MINFIIRSNIFSLRHCEEWSNHLWQTHEIIDTLNVKQRRSNLLSLIKNKGIVTELDKKPLNPKLRAGRLLRRFSKASFNYFSFNLVGGSQ